MRDGRFPELRTRGSFRRLPAVAQDAWHLHCCLIRARYLANVMLIGIDYWFVRSIYTGCLLANIFPRFLRFFTELQNVYLYALPALLYYDFWFSKVNIFQILRLGHFYQLKKLIKVIFIARVTWGKFTGAVLFSALDGPAAKIMMISIYWELSGRKFETKSYRINK